MVKLRSEPASLKLLVASQTKCCVSLSPMFEFSITNSRNRLISASYFIKIKMLLLVPAEVFYSNFSLLALFLAPESPLLLFIEAVRNKDLGYMCKKDQKPKTVPSPRI